MLKTDTSEKGLESLIVAALTGQDADGGPQSDGVVDKPAIPYGKLVYVQGDPSHYDRDHAVDLDKLLAFLRVTQPRVVEQLAIDADGPKRREFLARLQGQVTARGVVDVLHNGIKHGPASVDLFYGTPSPGNIQAAQRYAANVFSVTRQLRYSNDESRLALDLCLFINGLPVATFELKSPYQTDR